jgi:hypothetical protein
MGPWSPARMLALLLTLAVLAGLPLAVWAAPASEPPAPPHDDALLAPPRTSAALAADPRGASQFMAGRVAVRLVLPQNDGSREPVGEQWTPAQIAHVTSEVQRALDWWQGQLPLARLSFQLQVEVAPTAYEPVRYGLADEGRWIGDLMTRMGFSGANYFDQVYTAGDELRTRLGTDWTTTIFIVNSAAHPTGYFADGRFAYAYVNGPMMVLTSDAGAYGPQRLAPIVAHELGHIFGALDQYEQAGIPCTRTSGYLSAPTSNSRYGACGPGAPSIMLEPLGAFANGQIDPSALAQVGYHDSSGNGLIDPLDTTPTLDLSLGSFADGERPILSGYASDIPFPASNQPAVSINLISAIELRVNGGPWQSLPAADGAYNSPGERFVARPMLYDGVHTVEIRARNSAGVISPLLSQSITISGCGPQPEYRVLLPQVTR